MRIEIESGISIISIGIYSQRKILFDLQIYDFSGIIQKSFEGD